MSPIVDWYLNQLAAYGLARVIAAEAAACVAAWCGLGAVLHAAEQRRVRQGLHHLEQHANHTRKETP
ncbi:hypothetical protein [Streptomyces prasinopilosus]|uniref:hypothetical protein n=1 Tax=Streptomyces prasinopilosus TaxID=67344 RepID=UPI0006EB9087|nr:hypothetical protein [Streptomyces prasinopilosus]